LNPQILIEYLWILVFWLPERIRPGLPGKPASRKQFVVPVLMINQIIVYPAAGYFAVFNISVNFAGAFFYRGPTVPFEAIAETCPTYKKLRICL
jgi:hypothetical protein